MRKPYWRRFNQHWYVELNGKQVRLSAEADPGGDRRKEPPVPVQNAWHKLMREGQPQEMLLRDVFDRFNETCGNAHHTKSTRWMLAQFLAFVGPETKVSKLRPFHLSDFYKTKKTWGPATQRTSSNRILAAINFAVREGLIDRNPISSVPGFKRPGRYTKRKGTVDPELRQRLEAAASPALRAVLVGLRETGARPGELRAARVEKCDLEAGVMLVPNKTARATGQAERAIYLSDELKALVKKLIGGRAEGHVFLTTKGLPWSYQNLEERWRILTNKVPVPDGVTLYTYRRTWISTAINRKNVNPALVAQLVGHVGLDMMLRHYIQTDPAALKRAVDEISRPVE